MQNKIDTESHNNMIRLSCKTVTTGPFNVSMTSTFEKHDSLKTLQTET